MSGKREAFISMEEHTRSQTATSGNASASESVGYSVTGELRLHEFQSRVFRNSRMLRVWLPPGYNDPANDSRHYPVLYLNDGQNLFDPATAYIGVDWQVDNCEPADS